MLVVPDPSDRSTTATSPFKLLAMSGFAPTMAVLVGAGTEVAAGLPPVGVCAITTGDVAVSMVAIVAAGLVGVVGFSWPQALKVSVAIKPSAAITRGLKLFVLSILG